MSVQRILLTLAIGLMVLAYGERGVAAESAPIVTSHTRATLVTDKDTLSPDTSLHVGLRLQLQPGWHTYWVNPGDAGDAPRLTVKAVGAMRGKSDAIRWPVPERINEGGLMAYAYTGDLLLPQTLMLQGHGGTTLIAHAEWLVCAEVCVPEEGDFTLPLPAASQAGEGRASQAPLFQRVEHAMPHPSSFQSVMTSHGELILRGKSLSSSQVKKAWFLPFKGGVIKQTAEQPVFISSGELRLTLTPDDASLRDKAWAAPISGVVVMEDPYGRQSAVNIVAYPGSHIAEAHHSNGLLQDVLGHLKLLILAFLGGVILNLMPCVFPVLAMKALSLARMGGVGRKDQLMSALFYTLGVVGSFFILGGVLIALRMAGSVVGWGFQFQSSGFVVGVCWLLFLMALNLLGVFHITTGRLSGIFGYSSQMHGYSGDVLTGLLAVIVATPCTAPFMGVAIAGALSGPVVLGLLIFIAMGIGLAAPYVVVAGVPGVAKCLPKPGAWMDILKQILAFPLLATCVWLLWVSVIQRGADFVALVGGGLVVLGMGAWIYGLAQRRAMREGGRVIVTFSYVIALVCVLGSIGALILDLESPEPIAVGAASGKVIHSAYPIEPFSEQRLAALRATGNAVFVDMTASWCITCMVNERVALDASAVAKAFNQRHVTLLRGDWTNRDEGISAYLKTYRRDGVPLYVYYPPHGDGVMLPQVLTPGTVLGVLKQHDDPQR